MSQQYYPDGEGTTCISHSAHCSSGIQSCRPDIPPSNIPSPVLMQMGVGMRLGSAEGFSLS